MSHAPLALADNSISARNALARGTPRVAFCLAVLWRAPMPCLLCEHEVPHLVRSPSMTVPIAFADGQVFACCEGRAAGRRGRGVLRPSRTVVGVLGLCVTGASSSPCPPLVRSPVSLCVSSRRLVKTLPSLHDPPDAVQFRMSRVRVLKSSGLVLVTCAHAV